MSARAPSATEAADFVTYLKNKGPFSTVTIQSLTSDAQGGSSKGVRFNLTALKGG